MAGEELDEVRRCYYCSSSVENFKEKFGRKFHILSWSKLGSPFKTAVFFGMYNIVDYLRYCWHLPPSLVYWCGSDILQLKKNKIMQLLLRRAYNVCENEVEKNELEKMGILAIVSPGLVDDVSFLPPSFTPSKTPHVYLTYHNGRRKEYGIDLLEIKIAPALPDIKFHVYGGQLSFQRNNVIYHGFVSDEQFDLEIQNYQAALRLNKFEGFSEILAKSAVMGQYPISLIYYPHITHVQTLGDLIKALQALSKKKEPNIEARNYWLTRLL